MINLASVYRSKGSTEYQLKMANIEADPRDQAILDPFNLTDEQFEEFCTNPDSPLAKQVAQFDSEQEVIALLLKQKPTYSLEDFVTHCKEVYNNENG